MGNYFQQNEEQVDKKEIIFPDQPAEKSKSLSLLLSKELKRYIFDHEIPQEIQTLIVSLIYGDMNSKFLINLITKERTLKNIAVYSFYSGIYLHSMIFTPDNIYKNDLFPKANIWRKGQGWILVSDDNNGWIVEDNKTLKDQPLIFYPHCTIKCVIGSTPLCLYIKILSGKTIIVGLDEIGGMDCTVLKLKEIIQQKCDIEIEHQRLIFAGKQLEDGKTLSDYNMEFRCTLHLVTRPFGLDSKILPYTL